MGIPDRKQMKFSSTYFGFSLTVFLPLQVQFRWLSRNQALREGRREGDGGKAGGERGTPCTFHSLKNLQAVLYDSWALRAKATCSACQHPRTYSKEIQLWWHHCSRTGSSLRSLESRMSTGPFYFSNLIQWHLKKPLETISFISRFTIKLWQVWEEVSCEL